MARSKADGRALGFRLGLAAVLLASFAAVAPAAAAARPAAVAPSRLGDLLTYDYDNARSGVDPVDAHIGGLSSRAAWDETLDGAVYAQPLAYDSRAYVVTENDTLYALAAGTGRVLWHAHVGAPVSLSIVHQTPGVGCGNIDPLGITGTPVIDASSGEIYVSAELLSGGTASWQAVRHEVIAVSLRTHLILWRRDVDPPGANNPADYYIPAEQQRTALTLADGRVYVGLGGLYGDCGQYHGYVVSVPDTGRGRLLSYKVPTQREGAIWETNGVVVGTGGELFVATGNGSSNSAADYDEGNSVIGLTPALRRVGVWAPANWVQLNDDDWDLGSAGPIQVPGGDLLFVAGKPGPQGSTGYLLNESSLHGIGSPAAQAIVCRGGGVFGADAATEISGRPVVFVACGTGTAAFAIRTSPAGLSQLWRSAGSANGPPIIAGGLVFALDWNAGELYAMSPTSGAVVFQRATDPLSHFAAPGIGDGVLLVPTARGVEAFRTLS